jgi:hypothetical protein
VTVTCPPKIGLYILNEKRHKLNAIEARYEIQVIIKKDDDMYHHDFELEYETADNPFIPGLALRDEMAEELETEQELGGDKNKSEQHKKSRAKKQEKPAKPAATNKKQQRDHKKERQQDNKKQEKQVKEKTAQPEQKPEKKEDKEKEPAMAGAAPSKQEQAERKVGKTPDDQPGVEVNKKPEKPKRGWWQGLLSGMK